MSTERTLPMSFNRQMAALVTLEASGDAIAADLAATEARRAEQAARHAEDAEAVVTQAVGAMAGLAVRAGMPWRGDLSRYSAISLRVDAARGVCMRIGDVEGEVTRAALVGAICWAVMVAIGSTWFDGSVFDMSHPIADGPAPSRLREITLSFASAMGAGVLYSMPRLLQLRWRPFAAATVARALRDSEAPMSELAEYVVEATRKMAADLRGAVTALQHQHVPGITADAAHAKFSEAGVFASLPAGSTAARPA